VIWNEAGIVLTNAHVLHSEEVKVSQGEMSLPAKVIGYDREVDLSALYIDASDLSPIEHGDSRSLRPGQIVFAIGHPWGVMGAATSGVVIGAGEDLPEMPFSKRDWIATSLHYRPGHSGGPLVDTDGRLIGINTMMAGPDVGLAVPIHIVREFMKEALSEQTV
jgi:serine protease Do